MTKKGAGHAHKIFVYSVCVVLAVMCIFPFWVMFINSTRGTFEIQQQGIALLPSDQLSNNMKVMLGKSFDPWVGFVNSLIISTGAAFCAIYFSDGYFFATLLAGKAGERIHSENGNQYAGKGHHG